MLSSSSGLELVLCCRILLRAASIVSLCPRLCTALWCIDRTLEAQCSKQAVPDFACRRPHDARTSFLPFNPLQYQYTMLPSHEAAQAPTISDCSLVCGNDYCLYSTFLSIARNQLKKIYVKLKEVVFGLTSRLKTKTFKLCGMFFETIKVSWRTPTCWQRTVCMKTGTHVSHDVWRESWFSTIPSAVTNNWEA